MNSSTILGLLGSIFILLAARCLTLDRSTGHDQTWSAGGLATDIHLSSADEPLPILCPIKRWTSQECPWCGLTRAFVCIAHGRWQAAWHYHPASYLLFAMVCLNVPLRLYEGWSGWRRTERTVGPKFRKWERASWGTTFALSLLVGIGRFLV